MPYRKDPLVTSNFYHIFNRGVEKRNIFTSVHDYKRFLKTMQYYQVEELKPRFSRYVPELHSDLLGNTILVEIIAYCLMQNHFHMLVKQVVENGISKYISQLSNSYTKYFNVKYARIGPLFQGNFKAVLVENTEQLLHVSRYIHLNPFVAGISGLSDYKYSSLNEFLDTTSSGICKKNYVLDEFNEKMTYKAFIEDYADYALALEVIKHNLFDES